MKSHTGSRQQYVLGNTAEELERLDHQAASIERPTRMFLQAAGLTPGMHVLDLGSGLGHVARLAGEFVGPTGSVLGIDRSPECLAVARDRTKHAGMQHVDFMEGDATSWRTSEPLDAIVGRLLLFHVADPGCGRATPYRQPPSRGPVRGDRLRPWWIALRAAHCYRGRDAQLGGEGVSRRQRVASRWREAWLATRRCRVHARHDLRRSTVRLAP